MGEQFITCTITSETPIDWAIGDHCEFRGETFTLNYIPSVIQRAPINSVQDAFIYENVKLDSFQDELTRCMMLDVTPTTPEYQAVLGTNHTGSSRFQLYCGETTVNSSTLTAVCALALKMQVNLDRLYPNAWHIYVDTTTTYTTASGETLLVTHTDSKLLTFDNQTVAQALGLVHTEFKLDYCVKGRNIYIGYSVDSIDPQNHPITDLTGDDTNEIFHFGYGRGYADANNQGKSLFQIKQIANSQQKIVTRLRALGSTKNLPYNYYFKKYGLLSQSLFPNNLQLPGTFLPLGSPDDTADADGTTKWAQNNARSQYLRKVLGDTNDSYLDKNDDAHACPEGIREDCARWDGSNGDLPEIYPTIEGVTFGELRDAGIPDQTGATGDGAYQENETRPTGDPIQPDYERVDCLLAVGYTDNGVLIDDANIGDGIMPENEVVDTGTHFAIGIGQTKLTYNAQSGSGDFDDSSLFLEGAEQTLFTVNGVSPGNYFMVPTGPSYSSVAYRFSISAAGSASAEVGFVIRVKQKVGNSITTIATWYSDPFAIRNNSGEKEMYLPELPDQATSGQVSALTITALSDVIVTIAPLMQNVSATGFVTLTYQVGRSQSGEYDPEYTWSSVQGDVASKYPFHVFIKDMGFDLTATFNGETPVMAMKSGMCVGREFEIGENVQKATVNGIRGYLLTLNRVEDSNLHVYYPNEYYKLSAGDYFVLLNINMPDAYIRAAELRLLRAATEYLADNCDTKYTYQPSIDDIYLQRNLDAMTLAGTPEKSIFWRLYAGLKFRFNGIPSSANAPLPLVSITIEQVAITMGDGLTPKVEIVLNDDVQQTTIQKLTVAVDRIYNGSIFSSGGGTGSGMGSIVDIGSRLFLSKTNDDTASGRITFKAMTTFLDLIKAKGNIDVGDYLPGFLGNGAHIGTDGHSEFEEVNIRGALRAAELIFNQILASGGEEIKSVGYGEIETVSPLGNVGTATLKLDGNEWPTIKAGDYCRGLYNTVGKDYDNASITEEEDNNGFRKKKGFFSSYFQVLSIQNEGKGVCKFMYTLQTENGVAVTEHPCPLMKFAVYGNNNNTNKDRQSSIYTTAIGIAPRTLFLAGVNDWKIKPENIKIAKGNINGIKVWEELSAEQAQQYDSSEIVTYTGSDNETHYKHLKELVGDAGFYCEDNIYLGGIIEQIRSIAAEEISAQVSHIGEAWIKSNPSDRYVVDCYEDGTAMDSHQFTITVNLYFGSEICDLDRLNCWVDDGESSGQPSVSLDNKAAFYDVSIEQGENINTRMITFTLSGSLNGETYNMVKTIAIVANRQGVTGSQGKPGDQGANGLGAVYIDTNEEYFVVPCDSQGKALERVDLYIEASLKVGDEDATLKQSGGQCNINYNGHSYFFLFNGNLAYKTLTVSAGTTPADTLTITLKGTYEGTEYTKTKKIHVIAQKQGKQGDNGIKGSFKATAFKRTNTDIKNTTPSGGDYDDPKPTGWYDGIPDGEETLWATTCTFYGDGTYSGWSNPRKMTDTATYDVEFSPNEICPDDPSDVISERQEQGWYDPDASLPGDLTWGQMIWRAERECKNGDWGQWIKLKIKGENGEGVGIASITTYYLRTIKYQGVTVSDFGTQTNYLLPTAELPYLWRYTHYLYTDGSFYNSNPELIYTYSDRPNVNLLDDTSFLDLDNMDAWTEKGLLAKNTSTPLEYQVSATNGEFYVRYKGNGSAGEAGYINYLVQPIANKLSPSSWYTFSFEVYGGHLPPNVYSTKDYYLDLNMTGLFDSSVSRFIDGVASSSSNIVVHFTPTTSWTRHTVTFKTPSTIGDDVTAKWQMYTRKTDDYIILRKPKLEAGMVATEYISGSTSRQPMARTTRWAAGTAYFKGAAGERYIDIVSLEGKWYQCLKSHTSADGNKPQVGTQTTYWMPANNFGFIATDLLLADTGVINLLFGNTIYMRNKDSELTASINEDGRGGYIMYYPKSGRKMMEFSPDGYIYRYYDNDENSEAWNIGLGGDISKATTDAWQEVYLCLLPLGTQTVVTSSSEFILTKYWQFRSGSGNAWATYDKIYFITDNPKNPKTLYDNGYTLPNGLYTPDKYPQQMIMDIEDPTRYYIRAWRIIDGKKTEDLIIMQQT